MTKAAVIQTVTGDDVTQNLAVVEELIAKAADDGAVLVLLPENFALMSADEKAKLEIAEVYQDGPIQAAIADIACRYGIWVIAGTIPIQSTDSHKVRAASIVYNEQGKNVARYDKIHLFDVRVSENEAHCESACVEPGNELVVVDTPIGRVGLSVCYDLRFPEMYRQLIEKGAEIITVPAAFTYVTGLAHWEILLRTRAVENLCYVMAANQGGIHPGGRRTFGRSMIVEPWGSTSAVCAEGQAVQIDDIDLKKMQQLRGQFPCLDHKRL